MCILSRLALVAVALASAEPALAQVTDEALTPLDRKVMAELTGVRETPQVVFHYRPSDFRNKGLDEVVKKNLGRFHELEKLLKMKYRGRVHVFLYQDIADLQKMTGSGAVALSTGTVSIHQAKQFDSVHELTHIFALQFPDDEDAVSDGFAVEGIATTLAQVDEDVPIHSWAAVYRSASRLPGLVEFRRSWPKGAPNGVHPYHVAGSFVGYLIQRFGIEKVKRWYVNSTEAHMAFGKTFRRLERDWLAWLEKWQVKPKHRDHVLAKLGLLERKIPESYARAKGRPLFDGRTMRGLVADDPAKWKVRNGKLVGVNPQPWTLLHSKRKFPANIGVRVRFRLVEGNAVQVRVNRTGLEANQTVMARWATYLSLKQGGFAQAKKPYIEPGVWHEVVLISENGTGRMYLNGLLAIEKEGAFSASQGTIGIGIEKGTLEVESIETFKL